MWQKRLAQWKLEREARKKLLKDVLAVRAEQVQERCEFSFYTDFVFSKSLEW